MKTVAYLVKGVATSPIAISVAVLHLALYIYGLAQISTSPVYHSTNQPIFFQILVVLNLPAIIVAGLLQTSLSYSEYWWASTYNKFIIFSLLFIQWALIGYALESIYKKYITSTLR